MCNSLSHDTQENFSTSNYCRSERERGPMPKTSQLLCIREDQHGVYASADSRLAKQANI